MTRAKQNSLRAKMLSDTEQFLDSALGKCKLEDPKSVACRNVSQLVDQFLEQFSIFSQRALFRAKIIKHPSN